MKNCVLIPSYRHHKCYLDKFLYTIQQLTPNNIPIYIIISSDEECEFHYMKNKYKNTNLLIFSKIVEIIDDKKIIEDDLLKKCGKYNFQSLKKYYGIYYLFFTNQYDNVIVFDSESIIVRNVDINDIVDTYIKDPTLIYSENNICTRELHANVMASSKELLDITDNIGWFLEYYLWVYEKRIFIDFILHFLDKYDDELFDVFRKFKEIFIEVLYQSFIYKNNDVYKYKIINFDELVRNTFSGNNEIMTVFNSIKPLKPLEDCRVYVDGNNSDFIKKIYSDLQLQFYKTSDTINSLKFIMDMDCVKICVSEYSKIVFDNFHPQYNQNIRMDSVFVCKNTIRKENDLYSLVKNTNMLEPFHWLGYDITVHEVVPVKFSFELFFNKLEDIKPENFIGFKRHRPTEIIQVPINKIVLHQWMQYEFIMRINHNLADLYIIIFDNAPKCDVMIRNFMYSVVS